MRLKALSVGSRGPSVQYEIDNHQSSNIFQCILLVTSLTMAWSCCPITLSRNLLVHLGRREHHPDGDSAAREEANAPTPTTTLNGAHRLDLYGEWS